MSVRYIYNTNGDHVAFVQDDHLFNIDGEWLGFIRNGNEVYRTDGLFVGYLLDDDRIVRNKNEIMKPRVMIPMRPMRPLRPLQPLRRLRMPNLPYPYEDIFEDTRGKPQTPVALPDFRKYEALEGAKITAADGTYLGTVSKDKYSSDSISNDYGQYGSPYSQLSIFNEYGQYGSQYSPLSPFNQYSTTPPRIMKGKQLLGYLSANSYLPQRIDINEFLYWLGRK